ncbi:MAG TPA: DUF3857 domain-containing protein [Rhizomicrobium sp.]|nr:DUF3857 domain-containing protein [Rhizomicrobium sp.]
MRIILGFLIASVAVILAIAAPVGSGSPAFEVTHDHIDLQLNADGSFVESRDVAYKVLDEQGRQALQQTTLSYTEGYQAVTISRAYTLKANGTRIDVSPSGMLYGHGATSAPGFEDLKTVTVVFPNVEVGDEVVIVSVFEQRRPWFENQFAQTFAFSHAIVSRDAQIAVTTPASMQVFFDASAMDGGTPETVNGSTRRTWTFQNNVALAEEPEAISELDDGPHLVVTTYPDYAAIAHMYDRIFSGRARVTPDIQALADQLTSGTSDRREQTRLLYEWVSQHIAYVDIVLGAGGFVPHEASAVLQNRYGDCKDHVMLLGALLAAKGIASTPVLIDAGNSYKLTNAASPFQFNHLITYVPELKLYLDSTAQVVPFGMLPESDAGKPVVQTATGAVAVTPFAPASESRVVSTVDVTLAPDGSASGQTHVEAHGFAAVIMRAVINLVPANQDDAYVRYLMGPGASGTIDRGDTGSMSRDYDFTVHFRMNSVANFPGPGALPAELGFTPSRPAAAIAGSFPASRLRAYSCFNITDEETTNITLPPGTQVMALPKGGEFEAPEMKLSVSYDETGHGTIRKRLRLVTDHPAPACPADYYNRARPQIAQMMAALKAQILYK